MVENNMKPYLAYRENIKANKNLIELTNILCMVLTQLSLGNLSIEEDDLDDSCYKLSELLKTEYKAKFGEEDSQRYHNYIENSVENFYDLISGILDYMDKSKHFKEFNINYSILQAKDIHIPNAMKLVDSVLKYTRLNNYLGEFKKVDQQHSTLASYKAGYLFTNPVVINQYYHLAQKIYLYSTKIKTICERDIFTYMLLGVENFISAYSDEGYFVEMGDLVTLSGNGIIMVDKELFPHIIANIELPLEIKDVFEELVDTSKDECKELKAYHRVDLDRYNKINYDILTVPFHILQTYYNSLEVYLTVVADLLLFTKNDITERKEITEDFYALFKNIKTIQDFNYIVENNIDISEELLNENDTPLDLVKTFLDICKDNKEASHTAERIYEIDEEIISVTSIEEYLEGYDKLPDLPKNIMDLGYFKRYMVKEFPVIDTYNIDSSYFDIIRIPEFQKITESIVSRYLDEIKYKINLNETYEDLIEQTTFYLDKTINVLNNLLNEPTN